MIIIKNTYFPIFLEEFCNFTMGEKVMTFFLGIIFKSFEVGIKL